MTTRRESDDPGGPYDDGVMPLFPALLEERMRAGLAILVLALPAFGVGDLLFHRAALTPLLALKAIYLGAGLLAWLALRRPGTRAQRIGVSLCMLAVVMSVLVASDILVDDLQTTFLVAIVLNLSTAALLPWGAWPEAAATAVTAAGVLAHVLLQAHSFAAAYPSLVGTLLGALAAVCIAETLERSRHARAEAAAALRASEARKSAIVDAALDGIVSIDAEGRIVEFNPAAERTFGHARAAVLGRGMADLLVPARHRERHDHGVARYVATGTSSRLGARIETTALHADGREIPVEMTVVATGTPEAPLLTAYVRDITERRLAEEAQTSAALLAVGHEMMQLVDPALVVERLDVVVRESLGASRSVTALRGDAGDRGFGLAGSGMPLDPDAVPALLGRVDEHGLVALVGSAAECLPPAVAAELSPARSVLGLVLWKGGEILGLHLAGFDQRTAPFTMQERRLARGVAQIASMALTTARLVDELARASRVKSEFVSTISHELRTPINVVLGYAEMARDPDLPRDEIDGIIKRIGVTGHQLLELVEGALDIGRLETGRSDVHLAPLELRGFWHELHASCAEMPRRADVRLLWDETTPATTVLADARKLAAIVRNLVGNACKFTEHGHVDARLAVEGDRLHLVVADTGIGIRPEDRDLVFQMFRQADGSDRRRFGGSGVGLYIVRRFVEQLGGTLTLESAVGHGSTFAVTLPAIPASPLSRAA